jgi:hypothetical protein
MRTSCLLAWAALLHLNVGLLVVMMLAGDLAVGIPGVADVPAEAAALK